MTSHRCLLRRWLMSLVFCAGGMASELRFPLAGHCPLPARTQGWRRPDSRTSQDEGPAA